MTKFCKKCNTETERDGRGDCRLCDHARHAAYRASNKDKLRAKVAASNAAYRASNKDKLIAYYAANKDKILARVSAYYSSNKDKLRSIHAAYRAANPEARRILQRNRRARELGAGGKHTAQDIKQLFDLQRGKCACCKTSINDGYHVDHVIPLALGGSNDRLNLQLLCPTCNLQKSAKHPIDFMQQKGFLL